MPARQENRMQLQMSHLQIISYHMNPWNSAQHWGSSIYKTSVPDMATSSRVLNDLYKHVNMRACEATSFSRPKAFMSFRKSRWSQPSSSNGRSPSLSWKQCCTNLRMLAFASSFRHCESVIIWVRPSESSSCFTSSTVDPKRLAKSLWKSLCFIRPFSKQSAQRHSTAACPKRVVHVSRCNLVRPFARFPILAHTLVWCSAGLGTPALKEWAFLSRVCCNLPIPCPPQHMWFTLRSHARLRKCLLQRNNRKRPGDPNLWILISSIAISGPLPLYSTRVGTSQELLYLQSGADFGFCGTSRV